MQFLFTGHMLDTDTRELRRGGTPIAVQPQVFDLLIYLVQNRARVVSKHDLLAALWGGRTVADSTLATHINAARKAVGDSGEEQRLIRTIARKGIRFVGDVQSSRSGAEAAATFPLPARSSVPPSERPGIAVLPFLNLSGEPAQEYFSDGISEDIITALSKLRWFFVVSRNSSFSYRGKAVHMKQIAEELGVGYVLDGSVRKDGGCLRITVMLTDVATGSQVWTERYDRELADLFTVQDEITDAIAAAIEPQLYAAENFRARRKAPEHLGAWELVMRALWHFWRVTAEDNIEAQRLLGQAIAIDPNYAQALALLAVSHISCAHLGWEPAATAVPIAERASMAAVRADGDDPWAHLALGYTYPYLGRIPDSLEAFEAALRLNPNFALALGHYGLVLSWMGRPQEGAEAARRAIRLSPRDPLSAIYYGIAAHAAFAAHDYAEAIRLARHSIRERGDFVGAHRLLVAAAGMAGESELARTALQQLRRVQPDVSLAWIKNNLPPVNSEAREHYLDGLRRAGLE